MKAVQIPLIEPTSTRYIHVNPETNRVHLLVPVVGGQDISIDNTCALNVEINAFFGGGGVSELEAYKSVLEFHISLLEEGDARRTIKEERLAQINTYLEAVKGMRNGYQDIATAFLSQPSNLYSIQLRPREQDPYTHVVNPVFTINRGNHRITGTPLSPLYNKMHEVFPTLALGKHDPRTQLITAVLGALPEHASFEDIQRVLTEQCQILFNAPIDFKSYIKQNPGEPSVKQTVDKAYINTSMGFGENATSGEYIDALLGYCAPNLWTTLPGSPFYLGIYTTPAEQTERLSMMTQFYLGVMNVYCRAKGVSDKNFGVVLDGSPILSQALVDTMSQALTSGNDVESAIVAFFNVHKKEFSLSRELTPADKDAIQQKFEITYRTVTATKENPHMDDFMLLDTEARGKNNVFFTQKGLICTDFANIAPRGPHQVYFDEIREEAATHAAVIKPQDEAVTTVDIEPESLLDKLGEVQWDRLPKEVADACHALPAFQLRQFPDDVAKGKQADAEAILQASDDKQTLLRTPAKLTDYSGRTFNCTAYEYAYWAKDTHMCRMLERHMDDDTKTHLLEKVDELEHSGLAYQQHGVAYQNPHYDMSFVLKNLNRDEFSQLQTMMGQNVEEINGATAENYQTIPFTATEYEQLKKTLEQHKQWRVSSFFYTSPANAIANKLKFDFKSLITALDIYVNNCDRWSDHERDAAWLDVGKAQRDVPAHVAYEYCRADRSFDPCPEFNEATLPRKLIIKIYNTRMMFSTSWFPLSSSSSGLGFDFSVLRNKSCDPGGFPKLMPEYNGWLFSRKGNVRLVPVDLAAIRHLDEVRTADLAQSRENLEMSAPNHGLQS
jgi:hypothetical protein